VPIPTQPNSHNPCATVLEDALPLHKIGEYAYDRIEEVIAGLDACPDSDRLKRDEILARLGFPPFALLAEEGDAGRGPRYEDARREAVRETFHVACCMRGVFTHEALAEVILMFDGRLQIELRSIFEECRTGIIPIMPRST
jgi:hypothetical protein